ncbi:MAG TPA: TraB/GumN family protein [Arenimonas sp.]|uniref:TraB/GumN family protein n=1 Tax=Arenimonas sp. TaxID=1872635 RepID=UPI002B968C32|nr:TraB/GumN family protein [Arenimonas sp.]HMB56329.1 TraB/GumN family protein [Arenimonas sp.]
MSKAALKKWLPLLLLSLCCSCAQAEPPKPLLWKVGDADNHIYLLGSFHALKPEDYPVAPAVDAAFADAETVVFELSPQEMQSPELMQKMLRAAAQPPGRTLEQNLSPRSWQQLQAYTSERGLPLQTFEHFDPWFMALVISSTEMQRTGFDPKQGLDQQLMTRAADAGKPTRGLESVDEQIAALDSMSEEEQRQALTEALDESATMKSELDTLHAQWRAGDDKALFAAMGTKLQHEYPKLYQRIDVDRNNAWLPKIRQMLDQQSGTDTLVVVGSLHLLGPDGLIAKLKAAGYKVERL